MYSRRIPRSSQNFQAGNTSRKRDYPCNVGYSQHSMSVVVIGQLKRKAFHQQIHSARKPFMSSTNVVRSHTLKVCDHIEISHKHSELMIFGITAAIADTEQPTTTSALLNAPPQHRRLNRPIFVRFGRGCKEACSAYIEMQLGWNRRIWPYSSVKFNSNRTSTLCLLDSSQSNCC